MNPNELKKYFNLTDEQIQKFEEYQKKAEHAKILYCPDHDREYFDFETEGCPICFEEESWFRYETGRMNSVERAKFQDYLKRISYDK
jgi:hypothetical protein